MILFYPIYIKQVELHKKAKTERLTWAYLGKTYQHKYELIDVLGKSNRYAYENEFHNISITNKKWFIDEVGYMAKGNNQLLWWASTLSYKCPLVTDLFLNICYMKLIELWIAKKSGPDLIIMDNIYLLKDCQRMFSDQMHVDKMRYSRVYHFIRIRLQSLKQLRSFILRLFYDKYQHDQYILQKHVHAQIQLMIHKQYDVLTWIWIEDQAFQERTFSDTYLKHLYSYCVARGKSWIAVTHSRLSMKNIKRCYDSKKSIPLLYFTKYRDIWSLIGYYIKYRPCFSKDNELYSYAKAMIDAESRRDKVSILNPLYHYLTMKRVFGHERFQAKQLVYPFENQPFEKMMLLARQDVGSSIRCIGHAHTSIPYLELNYFLGETEAQFMPQPDVLTTNGAYNQKILENAGYTVPIINGGSCRYTPIHFSLIPHGHPRDKNSFPIVLVLLQYDLSKSIDLLHSLIDRIDDALQYNIKPHPDFPEPIVRKYISTFPSNMQFVSGSMDTVVKNADIVIHNGTTAAVECIGYDVPVIKYLCETLDLDSIMSYWKDQITITESELGGLSQYIGHIPKPPKHEFFEPFHENVWENLIS